MEKGDKKWHSSSSLSEIGEGDKVLCFAEEADIPLIFSNHSIVWRWTDPCFGCYMSLCGSPPVLLTKLNLEDVRCLSHLVKEDSEDIFLCHISMAKAFAMKQLATWPVSANCQATFSCTKLDSKRESSLRAGLLQFLAVSTGPKRNEFIKKHSIPYTSLSILTEYVTAVLPSKEVTELQNVVDTRHAGSYWMVHPFWAWPSYQQSAVSDVDTRHLAYLPSWNSSSKQTTC